MSTRRQVLAAIAGATTGTGCLRLTSGQSGTDVTNTAADVNTTADERTTESATATPSNVELDSRWQLQSQDGRVLSGWATDNTLYLGNENSQVWKVTADGIREWAAELSSQHTVYKSMAAPVDNSLVLAAPGESRFTLDPPEDGEPEGGMIYRLDGETGDIEWEYRGRDGAFSIDGLAVSGDTVYVALDDEVNEATEPVVYALDLNEGSELWTQDRLTEFPDGSDRQMIFGGIATTGNRVYLTTNLGMFVCDASTGEVRNFTRRMNGQRVVADENILYVLGYETKALDESGTETLWQRELPAAVESAATIAEDQLYVATREGHVYSLSTEDGTVRWRSRIFTRPYQLSISAERVWTSDTEGTVYAFSRETGTKVYESESTEQNTIVPVVATGEGVFIGGRDAAMYEPR